MGKIVLLGLGGAIGTYGFSSSWQAAAFATTLWNMFGEGWGSIRPFGWVTVDGFDLGIDPWKGLVPDQYRYRKREYIVLRRFCQRHAKLFLVRIEVLLHHRSTTVRFFPITSIDITDVLSRMLILA